MSRKRTKDQQREVSESRSKMMEQTTPSKKKYNKKNEKAIEQFLKTAPFGNMYDEDLLEELRNYE
jgi:hypothetical protein